MTKPDKLMNKIALSLFALCYVVMYTYGGITNGVLPMYKQFSGCWKAGSFVPVSAMVVSAELESHYSSDAATTYRVLAKFSYDYQGSNHIGQLIRLDDRDYDSIRSYHEDIHEQLSKARNSLSPVTLWVNPRKPDEAVYDRSLRWMLIFSLLPFVVLYPAVGLGAGWGLWRIWRKNDTTSNLVESAFKHSQTAGTSNRDQVVQGDGGGLTGLSIGCAFWNILSWPLAIMYFSSAIATSWWLLILPAIGLLLLFNVLQTIRTQRRIGKSVLILKGQCLPGSIPMQVSIQFHPALGTGLAFPRLTHDVKVTVECIRVDLRGDDSRIFTLWQGQLIQAQLARGTQNLNFKFDVPTDLLTYPVHGSMVHEYFLVGLEALGGTVTFRLPENAVGANA